MLHVSGWFRSENCSYFAISKVCNIDVEGFVLLAVIPMPYRKAKRFYLYKNKLEIRENSLLNGELLLARWNLK